MIDREQARAEVLAAARRLGDVRRKCHDSGRYHDEIAVRNTLDKACDAYSESLDEPAPKCAYCNQTEIEHGPGRTCSPLALALNAQPEFVVDVARTFTPIRKAAP